VRLSRWLGWLHVEKFLGQRLLSISSAASGFGFGFGCPCI
jgi:hypothetical protein